MSHDTGNGSSAFEDIFQEVVESTSLSDHQKHLLCTLLMYYVNIFAVSKDQLGHTDILQHKIVTENITPICQRLCRLSEKGNAHTSK